MATTLGTALTIGAQILLGIPAVKSVLVHASAATAEFFTKHFGSSLTADQGAKALASAAQTAMPGLQLAVDNGQLTTMPAQDAIAEALQEVYTKIVKPSIVNTAPSTAVIGTGSTAQDLEALLLKAGILYFQGRLASMGAAVIPLVNSTTVQTIS